MTAKDPRAIVREALEFALRWLSLQHDIEAAGGIDAIVAALEPQALTEEDKQAIAASSREIFAQPMCCYDADDVINIVHGAGLAIVRVKPSEVE